MSRLTHTWTRFPLPSVSVFHPPKNYPRNNRRHLLLCSRSWPTQSFRVMQGGGGTTKLKMPEHQPPAQLASSVPSLSKHRAKEGGGYHGPQQTPEYLGNSPMSRVWVLWDLDPTWWPLGRKLQAFSLITAPCKPGQEMALALGSWHTLLTPLLTLPGPCLGWGGWSGGQEGIRVLSPDEVVNPESAQNLLELAPAAGRCQQAW